MKAYNKIKNHRIKKLIQEEIKKHQLKGNIGAMNLLKHIGRKYY